MGNLGSGIFWKNRGGVMKYKNGKTGAIIEIESELKGGDWKELKVPSGSRRKKAGEKDGTVCNNRGCK